MKRYIYFLASICLLLSVISCGGSGKKGLKERPYIVTTTGMIADIVENIVGDSAKVVAIMNPGVDPHLYKASQGDLKIIMDADYIFFNGLYLEGKLSEILEKQSRIKPVIAVGDSIDQSRIIKLGDKTSDPHIWFDVSIWKEVSGVVLNNLSSLDVENTEYYEANAAEYMKRLDDLDKWVKTEIATIPQNRRVLITAHDAFSYFGRAYSIDVRGLQGISTLSEIGLRDVIDLVDFIIERDIPTVFLESSVSDKSLKAVIEGVNKRGKKLEIGGDLYSDAMGEKGTADGTYIGMVKHNVNTIVKALK